MPMEQTTWKVPLLSGINSIILSPGETLFLTPKDGMVTERMQPVTVFVSTVILTGTPGCKVEGVMTYPYLE